MSPLVVSHSLVDLLRAFEQRTGTAATLTPKRAEQLGLLKPLKEATA